MRDKILAELGEIEKAENVRVLYACESGSRAWGFASQDSDYDVRFLYVRPLSWYLSVSEGRDTLEINLDDTLDISGWDIKKALGLMIKSNPALNEWLGSPIVYREEPVTARLRDLARSFYQPAPAAYHYYHMARGNYQKYLQGAPEVWTKKYFYVLRPILAVSWIQVGCGVVPTEFQTLLDKFLPTGPVREAVDQLLLDKRAGDEMRRGPVVPVLNEFLQAHLRLWDGHLFEDMPSDGNRVELDQFFAKVVLEGKR